MEEELQCTICNEPLKDEEVHFCEVCKKMYASLYARTGGKLIEKERGAGRWKTPISTAVCPVRYVSREEWEARGNKWILTWQDEYERILSYCSFNEVTRWSEFIHVLWLMCDDKRGVMFPTHCLWIATKIFYTNPECVDEWYYVYDEWDEVSGREVESNNPYRYLLHCHPTFGKWLRKQALPEEYGIVTVEGKKILSVFIDDVLQRLVEEVILELKNEEDGLS